MSDSLHLEQQQPKAGTPEVAPDSEDDSLETADGVSLYYNCWNVQFL